MKAFIKSLFRCRHHDWTMLCNYWSATAVNGFGSPTEERCDNCGEYRHLVLDHRIMGKEEWHKGKHPQSSHPQTSRKIDLPDVCRECGRDMFACGFAPLCDNCAETNQHKSK